MLDRETLKSMAQQLMSGKEVVVDGRSSPVTRAGATRLRTVRFVMDGKEYQAIEQNPEKPSRWGKLAWEEHRVVQIRDVESGKYVAAVMEYGKRRE